MARTKVLHDAEDKWLLNAAEDEGLLNDGRNHSHPNCSAQDPVLFIVEVQPELCRASQKSNVKFDNDATSCQKFGIYKNVAFIMASILQVCQYKLKFLLVYPKNTTSMISTTAKSFQYMMAQDRKV
jgi:hypothetical protein